MLAPSRTPTLIGHDAAIDQFVYAYQSSRLHHAWMITGEEGIGKATLAFHLAQFVLSGGSNKPGHLDMEMQSARLVAGGAHPDLFVLARPDDEKTGEKKKIIPAEKARELAPFLHNTATYAGWRIAIIDEAHTLNRQQGQNAILKVIEEPPEKTIIFLTTSSAGMMLPTIRSRCRVLDLDSLTEDSLRSILTGMGLGDEVADWARLTRMSRGSVQFAAQLLSSDVLSFYDDFCALLASLPQVDMAAMHAFADKLLRKNKGESFDVLMQIFIQDLQDITKKKAMGFVPRSAADVIAAKLYALSADRLMDVLEDVQESVSSLAGAHLDKKQTLLHSVSILVQRTKAL